MENLKRSIRYQWMESKGFILKFWVIVLILDILFYFLSNIGGNAISIGISVESGEITTLVSLVGVNLMFILITFIVYNYERNYESFPLAISLNMTRKDYFVSFLVDNVMVSLIFATIQGILMKMDPFFVKLIGKAPLYDLLYFNTKTDNIFFIIFILFTIFLGIICFWNLIASLNYKFGYKIWIIAVVISMILSKSNIQSIISVPKFIKDIFIARLGAIQFITIFIGIGIAYMLNYLIVSRTDAKGKRA